ncbi:MAG: hypothetical protein K6E86_03375 [Bacteroidales bacterium]|nr:hypothetical protein [Bacteroidales bacterium]
MHHFISALLRGAYALGFGFILLFHTADIINYIPQLLGGLLMLETIAQLLELFVLKIKTHVGGGYFIVPVLILLYSLFLIFCCDSEITDNTTVREAFMPAHGFSYTTFELQLGGACFIAFLISEIVIMIRFMKPLFMPEKFAEEERIRKETARIKAEEEAAQLKAQDKKTSKNDAQHVTTATDANAKESAQ